MTDDRPGGFLRRFWYGDVRLVIMYWVFCVLAGALWQAIGISLALATRGDPTVLAVYFLTLIFYLVVWSIGTWRSATKYPKPFWGGVVKVLIVLQPILIAVQFVAQS